MPVLMQLPERAESAAEFKINFTELEEKISEKTKMIVINNPHNPTGKLFTLSELESIAELAKKYNLIVVADEVYEFHVEKHLDMIRFGEI